jgi:Flp pilus assembly protein TadD
MAIVVDLDAAGHLRSESRGMLILAKILKRPICILVLAISGPLAWAHERQPQTAKIEIQAGQPGCAVDVDSVTSGTTDSTGKLTLAAVDPGDHYLHVRCPGKPEVAVFISPKVNGEAKIGPNDLAPPPTAAEDPIHHADDKAQLERLVQQAAQLRAQAKLDEAVSALRQAMKMDPENSDLHRELGITFLLAKEWKRARVEMIEAIRHDQSDADAHNGLGYALEKLGDIDAALKEYRIATHLEPDDSTYRTHYLDALVKIQARQEAAKK